MIAICIPFLLIGGVPFRIGVALLGVMGYKEILDLKGSKNYPIPVVVLGLFVLLLMVFSNRDIAYGTIGLDYKYIAIGFLLMYAPIVFFKDTKKKYTTAEAFKLTSFVMFLGLFLNLISNLYIYERSYFFLIILLAIFTDTFAYVTGMAIGKHKNLTSISPNKSIEGFIGGIVMGTVLSSIYYMLMIGESPLFKVIPALLVLAIACEIGDLFYSAIKREHDIKDFSNLIPGHGGILDRIDSISFVTFTFILIRGLL